MQTVSTARQGTSQCSAISHRQNWKDLIAESNATSIEKDRSSSMRGATHMG